jgi:hypothetical protein
VALLTDIAVITALQTDRPTIVQSDANATPYQYPDQPVSTPSAPTLTAITGTSNGAPVEVVVTLTTPGGETLPSQPAQLTPAAAEQVQVTALSSQIASVNGYNVYAGAVGGPYFLQNGASAVRLGTAYIVPGTPATGTRTPPATNTATTIAGWAKLRLLSDGMPIWRHIDSQATFSVLTIGAQSTVTFG